MNIDTFWGITPYELKLAVDSYYKKLEASNENQITLAYMTALWAAQWFSDDPPESLDKLLGRKPEQATMTDEQMYEAVLAMHKAMGGE